MVTKSYATSQFAEKAGVTVRTLRYYDQVGLLKPSSVTEAGHQRCSDSDLVRLQQILALKFLGFTLEQVREILRAEPERLQDSLRIQKQMMVEKRDQVNAVIQAIDVLQSVADGQQELPWDSVVQVIRVMQMNQKTDWWKRYYTEEQVTEAGGAAEALHRRTAGGRSAGLAGSDRRPESRDGPGRQAR